jgi:short-chain fatty acids transporter
VWGLAGLDLNAINLGALGLGLALHPHLRAYGEAASEAARGSAGVIVQFPLYAGVMGLMQSSGLTALIAGWAAEGASATSFAPLVFVSAGLLNLFVPSGGGQWALQGPIVLTAGAAVGADLGEAVMAFSYGDAWTNLLQPFWALPLLAITGLRASELVGYTAALMLCVAPLYLLAFWVF